MPAAVLSGVNSSQMSVGKADAMVIASNDSDVGGTLRAEQMPQYEWAMKLVSFLMESRQKKIAIEPSLLKVLNSLGHEIVMHQRKDDEVTFVWLKGSQPQKYRRIAQAWSGTSTRGAASNLIYFGCDKESARLHDVTHQGKSSIPSKRYANCDILQGQALVGC